MSVNADVFRVPVGASDDERYFEESPPEASLHETQEKQADHTPSPTDSATDETFVESNPSEQTQLVPIRDPADVRTIIGLALAGICLSFGICALAALLIYNSLTDPPLVVVERNSDGERVVFMNGSQIVDNVSATRDRPGDPSKIAVANIFSAFLYKIDPETRAKDLESLIKMMVSASAEALMKQIAPELEQQAREQWHTTWEPQVTSVDPSDPYVIRVVGRQKIRTLVRGQMEFRYRQLAFNLRLMYAKRGRTERNQRTGFVVENLYDFRVVEAGLTTPEGVPIPASPEQSADNPAQLPNVQTTAQPSVQPVVQPTPGAAITPIPLGTPTTQQTRKR